VAIPDYQSIMLPLLQLASNGEQHSFREAVEQLADQFALADSERAELLPSGTAHLFANRVGWARTYLKQAGLLSAPKRGAFVITEAGTALLAKRPARIDNNLLNQYEAFRSFRTRGRSEEEQAGQRAAVPVAEQTPEDAMAVAYQRVRMELEAELLEQVKAASPAFFERLVVDLLVAMGYGGSRQEAGRAIGRSGDGGVDGMINEDKLGLDVLYIQAKRWDAVVGRPEIQKFAGALQGQRASKGVFITTSSYSKDAVDFANTISIKIILIDGANLVRLMVDHDVGVGKVGTYELKRIDTDYFEGDARGFAQADGSQIRWGLSGFLCARSRRLVHGGGRTSAVCATWCASTPRRLRGSKHTAAACSTISRPNWPRWATPPRMCKASAWPRCAAPTAMADISRWAPRACSSTPRRSRPPSTTTASSSSTAMTTRSSPRTWRWATSR